MVCLCQCVLPPRGGLGKATARHLPGLTGLGHSNMIDMENPKAVNSLTFVQQVHNSRGKNGLDKRVQGMFLKGSFLASKIDSFFGDGVGGIPSSGINQW